MTRLKCLATSLYISSLLIDSSFKGCFAFTIAKLALTDVSRTDFSTGYKKLRNTQLSVSTSESDSNANVVSGSSTAPASKKEEKPNREYSIQILNAIEELKREDWNGLLDENSRWKIAIVC